MKALKHLLVHVLFSLVILNTAEAGDSVIILGSSTQSLVFDESLPEGWKEDALIQLSAANMGMNWEMKQLDQLGEDDVSIHFTSSLKYGFGFPNHSSITLLVNEAGAVGEFAIYQKGNYQFTRFTPNTPLSIGKALSIVEDVFGDYQGASQDMESALALSLVDREILFEQRRELLIITFSFILLALAIIGCTVVLATKYSRTKSISYKRVHANVLVKRNALVPLKPKKMSVTSIWTFIIGLMSVLGALAEISGVFD
ncbi:MAG: hypothetical protein AAF391_13280 [Bacteroidota bacterium]